MLIYKFVKMEDLRYDFSLDEFVTKDSNWGKPQKKIIRSVDFDVSIYIYEKYMERNSQTLTITLFLKKYKTRTEIEAICSGGESYGIDFKATEGALKPVLKFLVSDGFQLTDNLSYTDKKII